MKPEDQNLNPSEPSGVSPSAAVTPVVSKTNWTISILFLILGILIGSGGLWAYQNYLVRPPFSTPIPSPVPTTDPTANWKTYIDPAGYFSLKYPPTMVLKNDHQFCESELVLANKDTGFSSKYQGDFVIDVCKIDKEFYPRAAFSNIVGKEEKITLDGKEGFVKTGEATFYKLDSKVQIKRLVFYENDADYTIDLRYIPGNPDFSNIFDQILSTFKFAD